MSKLRVLTFNLWNGGEYKYASIKYVARLIKFTKCDIAGLQEVASKRDNTRKIIKLLRMWEPDENWNYFKQGIVDKDVEGLHPQSIIFKGKLLDHTKSKSGIKVEIRGKEYWIFNVHLICCPYQPYQLLKIPYDDQPYLDTEQEIINSSIKTRGFQIKNLLKEIKKIKKLNKNIPIFITGDFNEPSFLDWTVKNKNIPMKIEWPSTKLLYENGFTDCYRYIYPDPIKHSGYTWPTKHVKNIKKQHHDRIDFVFVNDKFKKSIKKSIVIEEQIFQKQPSDHKAVLIEFSF